MNLFAVDITPLWCHLTKLDSKDGIEWNAHVREVIIQCEQVVCMHIKHPQFITAKIVSEEYYLLTGSYAFMLNIDKEDCPKGSEGTEIWGKLKNYLGAPFFVLVTE